MALIAEEVVEEWLNQQGFFTIRGFKVGGSHEMDILAVKIKDGRPDLRHYEVQWSRNPMGYICPLPKDTAKQEGIDRRSVKQRSQGVMRAAAEEWVYKKFRLPMKMELRNELAEGDWSFHFAVNDVKYHAELKCIEAAHIEVVRFDKILSELRRNASRKRKYTASGRDLLGLIHMGDGRHGK